MKSWPVIPEATGWLIGHSRSAFDITICWWLMINIDNNRGNAMEYWIPSSRTWIIPSKPIHFEWDSPVVTPFFWNQPPSAKKNNGRINSPSFMDDDFLIDYENITRLSAVCPFGDVLTPSVSASSLYSFSFSARRSLRRNLGAKVWGSWSVQIWRFLGYPLMVDDL
jgi:hypothetical protein